MKMPYISFIGFWKKHSPKEIEDFLICFIFLIGIYSIQGLTKNVIIYYGSVNPWLRL